MIDPCAYKLKLRTKYKRDSVVEPARCYQEAKDRAYAFWPTYEQVNRDYDPDDPVYSIVRSGAALSLTADHVFFKSAAAGQARVLELIIGGEGTASAVHRIEVAYMNATLATSVSVTPEKFSSRSPAAAGTYGNTNSSALLAGAQLVFATNSFGGFIDWKAAPGEELYYVNGEVIGVRSLSGTGVFSTTGVFEEM